MKPSKAIELPTSADLSECSYEAARDLAMKDYHEVYKYYLVVQLKVSLWDADEAIRIMAKYRNCEIQITQAYSADEWSVSFKHGPDNDVEVWTAGA